MNVDDRKTIDECDHGEQPGSADRAASDHAGAVAAIAENSRTGIGATAVKKEPASSGVAEIQGPGTGPIKSETRTERTPAAAAEESGARIDGLTAAVRIGLIALLAAGVGALGMSQSKILPDLGAGKILRTLAGKRGPDLRGFPLLDGDLALSSESMVINGDEVDAVKCTSMLQPSELTAAYSAHLMDKGWVSERAAVRRGDSALPGAPVPFTGNGQAMLGFRDPRGGFVGIVAFANPARGGSDYFVVLESPAGPPPAFGAHVPGREPPGVPVPAYSTREYCIERRGDSPSMMVLYSTQSPPGITAARVTAQMEEEGWSEPAPAKDALADAGDDRPMMFVKGKEKVLLSISNADQGPGSWITVVYRRTD